MNNCLVSVTLQCTLFFLKKKKKKILCYTPVLQSEFWALCLFVFLKSKSAMETHSINHGSSIKLVMTPHIRTMSRLCEYNKWKSIYNCFKEMQRTDKKIFLNSKTKKSRTHKICCKNLYEYKNKSSKMWAGGQNVQLEYKYVEGIHWSRNNVQYVLKLCYFMKSYQYFLLNLNSWEESTPYCWNPPPPPPAPQPTPKRRGTKRVETSKECVGWI